MNNANQYTAEELQQLLDMARVREAEAAKSAPRPVRVGSLVTYLDARGMEHAALVLELRPAGGLKLKVFQQAQPNTVVEAGPGRWRR